MLENIQSKGYELVRRPLLLIYSVVKQHGPIDINTAVFIIYKYIYFFQCYVLEIYDYIFFITLSTP